MEDTRNLLLNDIDNRNNENSMVNFLERFLEIVFYEKERTSFRQKVLIRQILFTGFEALPLVSFIALIIGTGIIHFGYNFFQQIGSTEWIYELLVVFLIRDIGPIIISVILLGRSGGAISTEIGIMKSHGEIDYLKTLGISPISYIVIPRVYGMFLSALFLMTFFVAVGVIGGYLVSSYMRPLDFSVFLKYFSEYLTLLDLFIMIFKVGVGGLMISLICCYHGLQVSNDITDIPKNNIKAVGQAITGLVFLNGLVTTLHYLGAGNASL